MKSSAIFTFF